MIRANKGLLNTIMLGVGAAFIVPLIIMFLTTFKTEHEVLDPSAIMPRTWTGENYHQAFHSSVEAPIGLWTLNSFYISCGTTLLVVMLSAMVAFSITRIQIPGGRFLMNLIVATMMMPAQLFLIPLYMILGRMHLLDTPYSLIFPATANGFGIFMISQFMRGIPASVEEAALIDGCSLPQVFWRVSVPLCGPALATLAVFTFIGSWNDYITPLVFTESVTNYTLPVGIALFQSSYSTQYGLTLATSLLSTIPLLFAFLIFQKQIIESMSASGLKD